MSVPSFLIQKQIHRTACIAASASSLLGHLGIASLDQEMLDEMIQRRMGGACSGFDALADSVRDLKLAAHIVVARPPKEDLEAWITNSQEARPGFLIAHIVEGGHHISVVFENGGRWYKADPGLETTTEVDPWALAFNYSGDVALVVPSEQAVAVIGWGSLIWNSGDLPIHLSWFDDGPMLPVEFARISSDGRVTLVLIDGAEPVRCCWALSRASTVTAAQLDLARRERTGTGNIHVVHAGDEASGPIADQIRAWAVSKRLSGVVWTGLPSNWAEKRGCEFSGDDAVVYLGGLVGDMAARAREYIEKAPAQVRTPVRALFEARLGYSSPR